MIYHVTAERTGKWWVLQAKEAPGAISQVSRLDQADQIREAIAFVEDIDESAVEYVLEPVVPADVQEHIVAAERWRAESLAASDHAASESRAAAAALHVQYQMPLRDVGALLGISHQRAHQLVSGGGPAQEVRNARGKSLSTENQRGGRTVRSRAPGKAKDAERAHG